MGEGDVKIQKKLPMLFLDGPLQTKFLYWVKFVFRVTRLQLPAGLVIPDNQVIS